MSERRYNGKPIDASWTSDLVDAKTGSTVGASDDGEEGRVETDDWPTAVPKSAFQHDASGIQSQVVKHLVRFPGASNDEVAQAVGCSASHVSSVRGKVSVFAEPSEVPFDIQEVPIKTGLTKNLLSHEECRFDADSWDELKDAEKNSDDSEQTDIDVEDVGRRYYENGESTQSIASDYGVSANVIQGTLAGYDKTDCDANSQPSSVREISFPSGVLSEKQKEVFEYLVTNPKSSYEEIESELEVSGATISRTKHRARCYAPAESLPFDAPDEPEQWALTEEDWENYQQNPPEAGEGSQAQGREQSTLSETSQNSRPGQMEGTSVGSTENQEPSHRNEESPNSPSSWQLVWALAIGTFAGAVLQRLFGGDSK